jgi:hypothetical protein
MPVGHGVYPLLVPRGVYRIHSGGPADGQQPDNAPIANLRLWVRKTCTELT